MKEKTLSLAKKIVCLNCVLGLFLFTNILSANNVTENDNKPEITGELKKWHKITLTFNGPETSETDKLNPYMNYRFDVYFTHEASGKTLKLPGYFVADGNAGETSAVSGNKWRVNFAPEETGKWNFKVDFKVGNWEAVSDRKNAGKSAGFMDGYEGTFVVTMTDIQAASKASSGASLEKWRPYDFAFTSSTVYANPFTAVTMTATFTGPGGRTLTVLGFYTKNNTWVVRFSPTAEGSWSYSTSSTDAQLSNQSGTISCSPNVNPNVHGAIQIDAENPRHFKYEDGIQYFMLGYELGWLAQMDFSNLNVMKTKTYIDIITANGFNSVNMALFAYDTPWRSGQSTTDGLDSQGNSWDFGTTGEFPWEYTGTKNHSSNRFNQAYWENLDRVVDYLYKKGVTAQIYLRMQPNKYVSGMYVSYQSEQENLLFKYAIARYAAYPNIVWDLEKELNSRASTAVIAERLQFIKAADGYKRLRTVHDADPYSQDTTANKNMDLYTDQNHPDQNAGMYAAIINQRGYLSCPVVNAEYCYQVGNDGGITYTGGKPSAEECLQKTCEVVMAGGYATYNYTYAAWDIIRWNEKPAFSERFGYLADFFRTTKWYTLSPNDSLIGGGAIGKHCLANPGSEYIIYLQNGTGSVNLTISGAASGAPLAVKWVDLNSGTAVTMPNVGNGTSTFIKPSTMSASPAMLYLKLSPKKRTRN